MNTQARLQNRRMPNRGYVRAGALEMYYEKLGRGRPLLLLHAGFSSIASSFGTLRPEFSDQWATLAVEQQAHGHTADIDRPLSYEQMVEDTAAVLRQLEVSDADVFGWSDGGIIALGLAIRHPQLTRRVAISGAGYNGDAEPPEFKERMKNLDPENEHLKSFREAYAKVAPNPDRWPTLIEKGRDMYLGFQGWKAEDLRRLAAPLLVMAGDRDFVTLEHATELYRLVPKGELAILPGSDHSAPLERQEWVVAMLREFYTRP
jgi:pimeloyl-ACP methyl ester carboxylesterase